MDTISMIYYSVVLMPTGLKIQNSELQNSFWFAFFSSKFGASSAHLYDK